MMPYNIFQKIKLETTICSVIQDFTKVVVWKVSQEPRELHP